MKYITLLPMIAVLVIFYLMVFIPESRRKKKFNNMLNELKVNDEIVTRGGVIGKIINLQEDSFTLQTGPDKIKIKFTKSAIASVINLPVEN
jgi:preprotein translocase subunit YajC